MKSETFKFIDLFAGIGGFHHALSELGGECVMACELDPMAKKVYLHSFGNDKFEFVENIRSLTRRHIEDEYSALEKEEVGRRVPDHDILCGGFPCQPFSKSGEQLGVKDKTRGTLFFDIVQIIESKRPKFIFLENVRNLAGPRHLDTWETIVNTLRGLDYRVSSQPLIFSPHLLPAELGGAPQVRDRVFIIGVRNDVESNQLLNIANFNELLMNKQLWDPDKWNICDYLDSDDSIQNIDSYNISKNEATYLEAWNFFVENLESDQIPGHPLWAFAFHGVPELAEGMADWELDFRIKNSQLYNQHRKFIDKWKRMRWGPDELTVGEFPISRQKFEWQARRQHPTRKGRTLKDLVLQFRPSGIRVKPPTYLPALVAISQTSVVGPALRKKAATYRKLTPIEAGRLQGIPKHVYGTGIVSDQAAYKQLGNAVNVGLINRVAGILLGMYDPYPVKEQQLDLM